MESLNKTSSGQSRQVPISPRREDSCFPPLQTGPRVPALVQELGSEELSCCEGDPAIGTPGSGGLPPMGSLCQAPCMFHLHIYAQDGCFYPILQMRKLRFGEVEGSVQGHTAVLLLPFKIHDPLLKAMTPSGVSRRREGKPLLWSGPRVRGYCVASP